MNILLDYLFPISAIAPTPEASTGFLKQVCVVVKPKDGSVTVGEIVECINNAQVAALTNNTEVEQLFNAGMSKVFVLPANDLDLAAYLEDKDTDFYTLLISGDFTDADITGDDATTQPATRAEIKIQDIHYSAKTIGAGGNNIRVKYVDSLLDGTASAALVVGAFFDIVVQIEAGVTTAAAIAAAIAAVPECDELVTITVDAGDETDPQVAVAETALAGGQNAVIGDNAGLDVGTFKGVVGMHSTDADNAALFAAVENRCCFKSSPARKARSLFYAFGSMLSNQLSWRNQQYITMPYNDEIESLGEAESLFDDKVSFVITDDQYGNRLALFACGGKAIVGPYIKRELEINLQSAALSYISGNQPAYTRKFATLLENALKDVVQTFIDRDLIAAGTVSVLLEQENFVASGYINIAEPKALWRVFGEMRQTL